MDPHRLHASSRIAAADWLAPRLAPAGSRVTSVVPGGFPAYVRILHPAHGANHTRLRWAEVAAKTGRTMHRLAQFHAINRPLAPGSEAAATPPDPGDLAPDLLRAVCAALAAHSSTPESCWFCLWNGYGWLHETSTSTVEFRPAGAPAPAPSTLVPAGLGSAPCVHLPNRDYFLFEGPVEAATELGWNMAGGGFVPQSPNLFWPDDHAWCAASEIDLFCTLVAGSSELAESLIADPRLEVWRVFPGDPVTWESDDKNM